MQLSYLFILWNINSLGDDRFRAVISPLPKYTAFILIKVIFSPLKNPSKIYGFLLLSEKEDKIPPSSPLPSFHI